MSAWWNGIFMIQYRETQEVTCEPCTENHIKKIQRDVGEKHQNEMVNAQCRIWSQTAAKLVT